MLPRVNEGIVGVLCCQNKRHMLAKESWSTLALRTGLKDLDKHFY